MRTTATAQVSSPLVERETRAAATSMRLRASLVEHGVSHDALARSMGIARQRLERIADPERPEGLRVSDLEALPVTVLRDLLGPVLEARGLAIVAVPQASSSSCAKGFV